MVGYGLWMVVCVGLFYTVRAAHVFFIGAMGIATIAAIVFGALHHRPRRRGAWFLIATAILSFSVGDVINMYLTDVKGIADPFPSLGDAFYLAFYPILVLGLIRLLRSGAAVRDRASLLDALTVSASVGLLSWIFLINPRISAPDLTTLEKVIAAAYPFSDVLLLTVLVRMATAFRRSPSILLLTSAVAVLLGSDVLYGVQQLANTYQIGGIGDFFFMAFFAIVAFAALHPSMVTLTEHRRLPPAPVSRARVAFLGLASLVPPAVLVFESVNGTVSDGVVIAVLCAVLFGLVVARLAGVVTGHRLAVARELGLRRAGAAMLGATSVAEVTGAIRAALVDLLPPNTPHAAAVVVTGRDGTIDPDPSGAAAAGQLDLAPVLRRVETATLDEAQREALGDHELTLQCSLPARRVTGHLYIAADDLALLALHEAAQVLASQAALALEGLAANEEVVRRESEVYFRTLVLNAADVILIVDDDNRIRYASPSAADMFGTQSPVGAALPDLIDPQSQVAALATLDAVRTGEIEPELADWTVRRGVEAVKAEVSCRDLRHEPTVSGLVITLRDVTERRRLERELLNRAYYDSLTGLPNRALFTDRIERATAGVADSAALAAVLLVGLDDFKVVNDTMGHDSGDELLVAAGQRLVAAMYPQHAVARLGGDEFGLLVDAAAGVEEIERIAERVVAAFAEPFTLKAGVVTCHASVGLVTTGDIDDGVQLLSRADIALAMAKSGGKSRWCRYEATLHTRVLERLQLRAALDQAISNREFILAYQPVVDLATGGTYGFEALVRWRHPTRGLVPPMDFIEIAEESGLIVQLGEWILKTAISTAAEWRRTYPDDAQYVTVNVSPRQFRSEGFVDLVFYELATSGLPPGLLILEITESLLLSDRDHERVWKELNALREIGVRIAIDDFGTGFSSLSYLHKVPVDIVKLDKSFVDTITTSAPQFELVKGIVQLAGTLHLTVVAEGVETDADRRKLLDAGCEYGQGFLFARPMYNDHVRDWLLDHVPAPEVKPSSA
jgi:diguanylate cyclase (GGDEF)-like protein/PAS domain S-box-containing protein